MSASRRYRLVRELGTGTFGTVYQAEMEGAGGFKKPVALKVLHPQWEGNKDLGRRFRDEARLLGRLHHRNIVKVDGLVRVGGRWAVVMEYVPGWDAHVVVKACRVAGEPFPVAAALYIVAEVASALDAAYNGVASDHDADGGSDSGGLRVIHRDIKPSNIRLTPDGGVKVLDFGIARAEFAGREAITASVRYGSIRYMAPERRLAEPDSPACDIYSLGAVLYELLMGRPLGQAETDWAQHTEKTQAALDKLAKRVGSQEDARQVLDLCAAMLDFDPEKRPSAADVISRARELARKAPNEDLEGFARRFLPQVYSYVTDTSTALSREVDAVDDPGSSGEVLVETVTGDLPRAFTEDEEDDSEEGVVAKSAGSEPLVLHQAGATPTTTGRRRDGPSTATGAQPRQRVATPPPRPEPQGTATKRFIAALATVVMLGLAVLLLLKIAGVLDPPRRATGEIAIADPPPTRVEPTRPIPEVERPAVVEDPVEHVTPVEPPPKPPTVHVEERPPVAEVAHARIDRTDEPPLVEKAPLPEPEASGGDQQRLRAVKFTMSEAESLTASCPGGAEANGTSSALVRDLRPGTCVVVATVAGREYVGQVSVSEPAGLACRVEQGALVCR